MSAPPPTIALLLAAGDNPDRLATPAAFAVLLGASPIPAPSGKTTRMRLNRGGDSQGNSGLWHIVIYRMASQPATKAYVDRRIHEGLTKPEIIRCLKRYFAVEVLNALRSLQRATPRGPHLPVGALCRGGAPAGRRA